MRKVTVVFTGILCLTAAFAYGQYDWSQNPGDGSADDPYQISEPNQLIAIGSDPLLLTKCYVLVNDIVFDPGDNPAHQFTTAVIAPDTDNASDGFQGSSFTGCLDGDGYQIKNLAIEAVSSNQGYLGLFGEIGKGGTVKNLTLNTVSIKFGRRFIGGLCGDNSEGVIQNVMVKSVLIIKDSGNTAGLVGGVCGRNDRGTVLKCFVTGSIETGYASGGLIGYNNAGVIDSCYAAVDVTADLNWIGGLIGSDYDGDIRCCTAVGDVRISTSSRDYTIGGTGGLIGKCNESRAVYCTAMGNITELEAGSVNLGGLIGNCYMCQPVQFCRAYGDVAGNFNTDYVGGLIGSSDRTDIEQCFAVGNVRGGALVGGLVGFAGIGDILSSYATGKVCGVRRVGGFAGTTGSHNSIRGSYAAGDVEGGYLISYTSNSSQSYCLEKEGLVPFANYYESNPYWATIMLSEAQMKQRDSFETLSSSYPYWKFVGDDWLETCEGIWRMCSDGVDYPKLAWENSMYGDFVCPQGTGMEDLAALAESWLAVETETGFPDACDSNRDETINLNDYTTLAAYWMAPILEVSGYRVNLIVNQGSGQDTEVLTIQNPGRRILNWEVLFDQDLPDWLTIEQSGGQVNVGESENIILTANGTGLLEGYYKYIFRIQGDGAQNSPGIVIVRLYVSPFAGGSGTPDDPFLIENAEQLIAVGDDPLLLDRCFKLTCDIDLSGIIFPDSVIAPNVSGKDLYSGNGVFKRPFNGVFDGNGHRILNLTIEAEDKLCVGLFGQIGRFGEVKGLGLENVSINGDTDSYHIGALAGWIDGSRIYPTDIWNRGKASGCYVTGIISGNGSIGGITGINGGLIEDCYTDVSISGTGHLGGIAGSSYIDETVLDANGKIYRCYAVGSITGTESLGGITSTCFSDSSEGQYVSSCYFLDSIAPQICPETYPLTDARMKQQSSYADWDFMGETANGTNDIWWIDEGNDYPHLWWEFISPPRR